MHALFQRPHRLPILLIADAMMLRLRVEQRAQPGGSDHGIVKSWMPTQIWIDEEKYEYRTSYHKASALSLRENWNGYKLYARTQRSRPSSVAYALSLKRNQGYALVSMEATGFKTMGPMRYNCAYVAQ